MSASDTTNWGCPGCGAVLTPRTAVAHVCGAGTGCESENAGGAADTGAQGQPELSEPTPAGGADDAMLAQLDRAYQTHCTDCYMGTLEWCEGGLAPNGQPCATTDAERIVYLLDVLQRVVAQRDAADVENRALTARLVAVERERGAYALIVTTARACFAARTPDELAAAWERLGSMVEEPPDGR